MARHNLIDGVLEARSGPVVPARSRPDPDILLKNLMRDLRGRRNYGEMRFIEKCLQVVIDEDIFHFVIIGTHWFYEVKDDLIKSSGDSRRRVHGTGTQIFTLTCEKLGVPEGNPRYFLSNYYSPSEKETFFRVLNAIRHTHGGIRSGTETVADPARPDEKKEPWHYLE